MRIVMFSILLIVSVTSTAYSALVGTEITVIGSSVRVSPGPTEQPITVTPQGDVEFTVDRGGGAPPELLGDVFDDGIELVAFFQASNGTYLPSSMVTFGGLDWGGTGSLTDVSITSSGFSGTLPSITFAGPGSTGFVLNLGGASHGPIASISIALTSVHAVPTPSAMLLMSTGLLCLIGWHWRSRKHA